MMAASKGEPSSSTKVSALAEARFNALARNGPLVVAGKTRGGVIYL